MGRTQQSDLDFINKIRYYAIQNESIFNIPAEYTIAVACLETGFGTSKNCINNNNLFGIKIKSDIDTKGGILTPEYIDGEYVRKSLYFRKYASIDQSVIDFCYRVSNKYYYVKGFEYLKVANETGKQIDFEVAVKNISKIWGSDPHYADKVLGIIEEYNLALIRA